MNSKKALEQLYIISQIGITSKENEKVLKDCYKVVLRDLNKLEKLKAGNQVLLVRKNVAQCIAKKFKEENDRLKQLIEKIKALPNCDICDENWHKGCMCLKRKIEEVLENDK